MGAKRSRKATLGGRSTTVADWRRPRQRPPAAPAAGAGAREPAQGPRAPIGTTPTSPGRTEPYPAGTITASAAGGP